LSHSFFSLDTKEKGGKGFGCERKGGKREGKLSNPELVPVPNVIIIFKWKTSRGKGDYNREGGRLHVVLVFPDSS